MVNRNHKARLVSIANQYGVQIFRLKPYDSLYKKNAVYCASTNKGKFLIKAFYIRTHGTKLTKEQQSNQVSSYIQKLKHCKYPNFANWLTTSSGRYYVNKNGKLYYMTEWIEGRGLQNNVQDYEALGRALANLHTICKDYLSSKSSFTKRQIKFFKLQERLFRLRLTVIRGKKRSIKNGSKYMLIVAARWPKKHGKFSVNRK